MPTPIDKAGTIPEGSTERWKDKKRYLWLIALVMPSLAFAALGLHALTGWGLWLWIGPIVILGIVPVIDLMTGLDRSNPPDDLITALEGDKYYRWITYLFLPLQYAGFVTVFWFLAHGNLSVIDKVGLALAIGVIGGIGINTAHELGHKKESLERWLSKIALAPSFYGHFYIEHNHGHHSRVATPQDPASSRVGESFYRFWPRTVLGSLTSAWRLEKRRFARRGQHPFRIGNDVLNAWLMSVVLWGVVLVWLGIGVLPYLALQAVKDIEYRAILECETLGLGMIVPRVGPEILHGIEINPFAAELARTTIWIGDIQWRVKNAITHHPRPILRKLDAIECRDALLTAVGDGRVATADSTPGVMAGLDPAIHAPGKRTAALIPGTMQSVFSLASRRRATPGKHRY